MDSQKSILAEPDTPTVSLRPYHKGLSLGELDFRTKLNQVEGVASEVGEKRVVQPHLRRREVEVPRNDGLDACLNGFFHLPSSLPHKCQGNVNDRQFHNGYTTRRNHTTGRGGGAIWIVLRGRFSPRGGGGM